MNPSASSPFRERRGSVLIITMLLMAVLALVLGSYFNLSLTSSQQTRRIFDRNTAFHLAEAGVEEAVWSYNQVLAGVPDGWSDWNTDGVAAWRKLTDFSLTPGSSGSVKVYASNITPTKTNQPVILAESTVQTGNTAPVTQMIEVTLRRRSFFANGLTATRKLLFRGSRTLFDSWASDPDQDPSTAPVEYGTAIRSDLGGIATGASDDSDLLLRHAEIHGFVSTAGAIPHVGDDGFIGPFGTAPGVVDPSRFATDFNADFPVISAPTDTSFIYPLGSTLGLVGQATRWHTPFIKLFGFQTLTILGHVTLVVTAPPGTSAIDITGFAAILIPKGSTLTIYVEGDVKISGQGLGNGNVQPASCKMWGTNITETGQVIGIRGRGSLRTVIYAPNGDVTINGNGHVMGSIVARDITFTGNAAFHHDLSLADLTDHAPFGVKDWTLVNTPDARAAKAPLLEGW